MGAGQELEATRARELAGLEKRIETAFRSAFVETGLALQEIRHAGLYRLGYKTFAAYLAGRWEISEAYGYRLMESARVWRSLSLQIGEKNLPLPAVESHVRALSAAPPDRRAEVWRGVWASTGGHPTARKISEAARQARPEPEKPAPRPEVPRRPEPRPQAARKPEPEKPAPRPEPEVPRQPEPVPPPVSTTTDITTYERLRAEFASQLEAKDAALKAKDAEITLLKRQLGVRTPAGMPECMWCGGTGVEPAPLPRRTA